MIGQLDTDVDLRLMYMMAVIIAPVDIVLAPLMTADDIVLVVLPLSP